MSQSPILRRCVACKKVLDRKCFLKVTRDFQNGVVLSGGMGRSAYLAREKSCFEKTFGHYKKTVALKYLFEIYILCILHQPLEGDDIMSA